jgi:glutaminyl-peptide cyclotransferase
VAADRLSLRTTSGTPPRAQSAPCRPATSASNVSPNAIDVHVHPLLRQHELEQQMRKRGTGDRDAQLVGGVTRAAAEFQQRAGHPRRSTLRKVKLETGQVVQQRPIEPAYSAEGLTAWNGELVQLTWQSHIAFVYDLSTFGLRRTLSYSGEGWGLTNDGTSLILSDGTATLRFFDPATFRETRRVVVRDGDAPVADINELEFVAGEIFANVWHTNRIARIAPSTGRVNRWIDVTGLLSSAYRLDPEAVLNGIACDAASKRLFVTGKLWPKLFEIQVVPKSSDRTRR